MAEREIVNMNKKQLKDLGIKVEENKDGAMCDCVCHEGEYPMDCIASCDGCAISPEEYCKSSERVDGKRHSWHFEDDDPYVICFYCKQTRDALSGRILK